LSEQTQIRRITGAALGSREGNLNKRPNNRLLWLGPRMKIQLRGRKGRSEGETEQTKPIRPAGMGGLRFR
jgi:hypothetical protein